MEMRTEELRAAARKSLDECLADSVVPKELWPDIEAWLVETGLGAIYLEGREAVGAWWASREVARLGYAINFAKCGCLPGNWFPEGENWLLAQAEAKLHLVADWETLITNAALERI